MTAHDIGIVGAGAWGTALGINLATAGHAVALWGREVTGLIETRENVTYLPGILFPEGLAIVRHLEALGSATILLLAVPAQNLRTTAHQLAPHLNPACRLVICAKGIERDSGKTLTTVLQEELPHHGYAVLSGPTFANEVARGLPTAATLAAVTESDASALTSTLSNTTFRLYHSTDVIGVELAGAVKNVIAIACGIVSGGGYGENARAALMSRGLAEITRLALRLGARPETLMGLSGLGDIALTCSSLHSRNFSFGYRVSKGERPRDAEEGFLVEGVATTEAVLTLADAHDIEMPIATAVANILSGGMDVGDAVMALMQRPLKTEGL